MKTPLFPPRARRIAATCVTMATAAALVLGVPAGAFAAPPVHADASGPVAPPTQHTAYYPDDTPAGAGEIQTTQRVDIATSQDGFYTQYRIPAMIVTKDGTVITSYDGRRTIRDLPSYIDNIVRISHDGGKTWDDQQVTRHGDYPDGFGDPSLGYNPTTNRVPSLTPLIPACPPMLKPDRRAMWRSALAPARPLALTAE